MFDIIKLVNTETGFESYIRENNYPGCRHTPLQEAKRRQAKRPYLDIYYETPGPTPSTRWSHKPRWTKL